MIKHVLSFSFYCLVIVFNTSVWAIQDEVALSTKSIILADGPMEIHLQESMQWLEGNHQRFSLGQLQQNQNEFQNIEKGPVLKANLSYWLRFQLINPFEQSIPIAVSFSSNAVYIDGGYSYQNNNWQRIPGLERSQLLNSHQAFIFNVAGESNQWVYFRIHAEQTSKIEPKLQDIASYGHDLSKLQQIFGATIALLVCIILLHSIAIRFHNHVRHYMVIYMSLVGMVYALTHSPSEQWPSWLNYFSNLTPWFLACGLGLSSFKSEFYSRWFFTNRTILTVLFLLLISLFLIKVTYLGILICALLPCIYVLQKSHHLSVNLTLATLTLVFSIIWQGLYIIQPDDVFAISGMMNTGMYIGCILLASMSMIMPYFRQQNYLSRPSKNSINSVFLSKLSHELRTPMNGVLGMGELLSDTPLSYKQRDYLDTIQQSGQDMLRMINRLSDLARINRGALALEDKPSDIIQMAEASVQKFQPVASQKQLELVLNFVNDIPALVNIDGQRLLALFENLLEGSLLNTEFGEVELRIEHNFQEQTLIFSIRDTGHGLNKATLNYLLESDSLTKNDSDLHSGTFTIYLCKKIIELMGGHLFIESRLNHGSSFHFTLPYRPAVEESGKVLVNQSERENVLQGLSILIVDDNSTLRKVIQRYAKSWGMQADSTYNGKEALAMLRAQHTINHDYDIVLIDQDMPIMDGFQLATRIGEDREINQNIIKIMLTGLSINNRHQEVIKSGIHQVITKPVSARELHDVLSDHVRKRLQQALTM